jgi:hypothetical protein
MEWPFRIGCTVHHFHSVSESQIVFAGKLKAYSLVVVPVVRPHQGGGGVRGQTVNTPSLAWEGLKRLRDEVDGRRRNAGNISHLEFHYGVLVRVDGLFGVKRL